MQSLLEGLLHASPLVVACIVFALVFAEDALFLGRFTAFFRAVMPALAGLSQMPYRRFAAWNFTGGII
ncbi:hypothetical protein ACIPWF_14600 [Paenarthrobacter sp. NPDC089989]|uniref:hypothetical protein n=1 Tax=unclassified Paenarthrobacter TaxID=2634190 RepID=UPI00381F7FBD